MIAQLVSPNDRRWRRLLNCVPHDAYQLPEYTVVSAHVEGGTPAAFYTREGNHALLVPLLIRELPQELGVGGKRWDAASPYGYSGPIATPGIPLETLRRALGRFHEVARENGLVSAFIRLNPLRSVPVSVFEEHATVVDQGLVFYIDLRKPLDEIWAQTRPNHRRDIARLIRLGYVVQMDDWSAYSTFRRVYRMTMRRRSAAKSYYLSDRYFDELHEKLADHLHLCIVRAPTGEVAAGGLFVFAADVADYHLGGTADGHLRRAPSKLMFDFARRWAKQRGASILNLGGGIGGSPGSLEHFKKGFTRAGAHRFTARFIFDEESYIQLTAAARNHGLVDESPDAFFPAYRQVYAAAAR